MDEGSPIAERLAQLREENEYLRQAAYTFGELAERLMRQLDAERHRRPSRLESRTRASRQRLQHSVVPATTNYR